MNTFYKKPQQGFQITPQMQMAMNQIGQQVQQLGMTPEQYGRQLIQNGQMSPQQFEQYRAIANAITGMNL